MSCIFMMMTSIMSFGCCSSQVTTDLLTRGGKDIAFGDFSATWRFHRKVVHGALCAFGEGSASIEKIGASTSIARLLYTRDQAVRAQGPGG